MQERQQIEICLIATNKYTIFVVPLIESIKRFFLIRHSIEITLFTDNISLECFEDERVSIVKELIPSYRFPEATLMRYHIMTSKEYKCDYIYYLDIDYLIVSEIDEEIFGNIVAVLHPGFSMVGGGSWCNDKRSNAYTYPENREQYFCGGTQGGRYEYYYPIMKRLKREIEDDEQNFVRAEWNDEGHWNKLLSELKSFKILDSRYCMVQSHQLQIIWKINHFIPKIIALDKDHKTIRE